MSRVRLLLLSLLALSAVGVVTASSAAAHEWLKNGAALAHEEEALSEGGLIILLSAGKEIHCEKFNGIIHIFPGNKTFILHLHLLGCVTAAAGCLVHSKGTVSKLILLENFPDELILAESHNGTKVIADEFKENSTTKELVTLEFEPESACKPAGYVKTKVKGHIAGEVSGELITFPNPELKGNTLEAFGSAASLFGDFKLMYTLGGTLSAI